MNKRAISLLLFTFSLAPILSFAAVVGDPAMPLAINQWIKGNPVDVRDGKHIFVIEFWAALSPASLASIPKLNELQKKYMDKDVVIVGVSDEPADKLKAFIQLPNTQIDYVVAADDKRKTARNYMVPFGQNGLPHVFVVGKDGKILWHGHPLNGLDQILDAIVAGKYDLQLAVKADSVRAEMDEYRTLSRANDPKARDLGMKLLAARTNNFPQLLNFAYRIITDVHNTNRDFLLAGEALDKAEKLVPPKTAELVMARGMLLFESGKREEGLAMGKQAVDLAKDEKEKASVKVYLRIMEDRKAAEEKKGNQGPIKTNAPLEKVSASTNTLVHPNP
jgi:alkyl hydroperoxide reductase subunit AhpC